MTKILKFLVLVRDRPFLFFSVTVPLTLLALFSWMLLFGGMYYLFNETNSKNGEIITLISRLMLIPIAPFFFGILIPFGEAYIYAVFRVIRLNKILGFRERKFANSLAGWAEKKLGNKTKCVKEDNDA